MKRRSYGLIFLLFSGLFLLPISGKGKTEVTGIWQGMLSISGTNLRIVFKISRDSLGALTATMDSPDQGATNIPVSKVLLEGNKIKMEVGVAKGIFEGTINPDFSTIEGEWKQGGLSLPLTLKRVKKTPEIIRPQEPKKPYPYIEEEVVYENKEAGIKLAGTFTRPKSSGPFPTVLLISGSGPQDRNETVFGHKPFLVIADYLTRRGIAVLRVDDRGVGKSTGSFKGATSEDFASDVLAGINYLKSRKDVDKGKIGLIGHSEGGIIAPMVAVRSPDVAFIVMIAGPGIPGDSLLLLQAATIGRAGGASEEEIKKNRDLQVRIFDVVRNEKDNKIAERKLKKIFEDAVAEMNEKERASISEESINAQIKQVLSPWFRFFITYDPEPTLEKVKCPVLAVNGEKDLQVPPEENLNAIVDALKAGGNRNYTVKELKGLNHLLQPAKTGSPAEYSKIEETISPTALKVIGDWILKQTKGFSLGH